LIENQISIVVNLAKIKSLEIMVQEESIEKGCIVSIPNSQIKIFLNVKEFIQFDQELAKLEKKMA